MNTRQTLALLRAYESRNVTFIEPDGSWPIVWERARGVHVWDAEGKRYLDLTAAFGVAAAGHANPRVVRAGQRQMASCSMRWATCTRTRSRPTRAGVEPNHL